MIEDLMHLRYRAYRRCQKWDTSGHQDWWPIILSGIDGVRILDYRGEPGGCGSAYMFIGWGRRWCDLNPGR